MQIKHIYILCWGKTNESSSASVRNIRFMTNNDRAWVVLFYLQNKPNTSPYASLWKHIIVYMVWVHWYNNQIRSIPNESPFKQLLIVRKHVERKGQTFIFCICVISPLFILPRAILVWKLRLIFSSMLVALLWHVWVVQI